MFRFLEGGFCLPGLRDMLLAAHGFGSYVHDLLQPHLKTGDSRPLTSQPSYKLDRVGLSYGRSCWRLSCMQAFANTEIAATICTPEPVSDYPN